MDKVRFSCPRCRTVMQTGAEKVGYQVACPECAHRFSLVNNQSSQLERSWDEETTLPHRGSIPKLDSDAAAVAPPISDESNVVANPVLDNQKAFPRYACPYCGTQESPYWRSEVSTVGWIVFVILLISTCVLCFIGLFIRDKYRVCSKCHVRLE